MGTQLLFGTGNRVLNPIFLFCLCAFASPAARAADPAFDKTVCTVQSISMGGGTVWQIKGTAVVINLPDGTNNVTATIRFQKLPAGTTTWTDMTTVTQSTQAVGGTANIDTGFISFGPAPASGDQYRFKCDGFYVVGGKKTSLTGTASLLFTPIP